MNRKLKSETLNPHSICSLHTDHSKLNPLGCAVKGVGLYPPIPPMSWYYLSSHDAKRSRLVLISWRRVYCWSAVPPGAKFPRETKRVLSQIWGWCDPTHELNQDKLSQHAVISFLQLIWTSSLYLFHSSPRKNWFSNIWSPAKQQTFLRFHAFQGFTLDDILMWRCIVSEPAKTRLSQRPFEDLTICLKWHFGSYFLTSRMIQIGAFHEWR